MIDWGETGNLLSTTVLSPRKKSQNVILAKTRSLVLCISIVTNERMGYHTLSHLSCRAVHSHLRHLYTVCTAISPPEDMECYTVGFTQDLSLVLYIMQYC